MHVDSWALEKCRTNDIVRWQKFMIVQNVERAVGFSGFYAKHFKKMCFGAVEDFAWFEALPFTSEKDIEREGKNFLCVPPDEIARIRSIRTSASMGAAKKIYFTQGDLQRTVNFFANGMRHIVEAGEVVSIMMSDGKENSIASLLAAGLERIGVGSVFCGVLQDAQKTKELCQGTQCYVGLPADILYLCRKFPELRPKTILLSADYIPIGLVATVEKVWRCKVYSHYGLSETGYGLAVQCEKQDAHHIRTPDFYVEIVDPLTGKVLPDGCVGEVVVTSLQNEAMPLIRYRTGDIASLHACACDEQRQGRRLGRVLGRQEHLQKPLNIHGMDDCVLSIQEVYGYQAQWVEGELLLRVECEAHKEEIVLEKLTVPAKVVFEKELHWVQGKRRILQQ